MEFFLYYWAIPHESDHVLIHILLLKEHFTVSHQVRASD